MHVNTTARRHRLKSLENERFRKGSASLWVQRSQTLLSRERSLSRCGDGYGWRRTSGSRTGMILNDQPSGKIGVGKEENWKRCIAEVACHACLFLHKLSFW